MMRCEDALLLLSRQRDGELDAAGTAELGQHLQICDDCRLAATAWDFHAAWQKALAVEVPVGFASRVLRRAQQQPVVAPVWALLESLAARFLPVAVAAVLVLGITFVALMQRDMRLIAEWESYEELTAETQRREFLAELPYE